MTRLSLERIRSAVSTIAPVFLQTPQYECEPLSDRLGCRITLKVETLNPIRCFKGRGTEVAVARMIKEGHRSAVCASAGNLGQALAYSGRSRGVRAIVVAAKSANALKLQRIRCLGADVRLVDGDFEHARETARQISEMEGAYLLEDSENLDTCEGAGTMGLELAEVPTPLDTVLLALGGGAMATGVGYVLKRLTPNVEVVCIQPEAAPAMTLSWRKKEVVTTETMDTIADGVAGRFPIPEVLDDLLEIADDAVLVREESIVQGMRFLYEQAGLVVEPSAALGVAAVLENRPRFAGKHVASIICGSNVNLADFRRWVQ
ncbi:threonine ammonia-lyase [Vacuolonema iberomarrocanum]|uniref:threonine ammonia-lyase n=1 Tax=Vacuolonema iberomarrocanum TaxID=3454632 RepID=UPI003F6E23F8